MSTLRPGHVSREQVDRYARITVAATAFLSPTTAADKMELANAYARMRSAMNATALTEFLMWDSISHMLHEGLITRDETPGTEVYSLTADGDIWLVGQVNNMGESDTPLKEALTECGLDPREIVMKMTAIGAALQTMASRRSLGPDESYMGYVLWQMRWEPARQWSIEDLATVLHLDEDVARTQIDAAMRMDWLHVHNAEDGGRTYSLSSLGVRGAGQLWVLARETIALGSCLSKLRQLNERLGDDQP